MKNGKQWRLLLVLFLALMLLPVYGMAEVGAGIESTATRDGIEAIMSVDKTEYSGDEPIHATLQISNHGNEPVKSVSVNAQPPLGYSVSEGSLSRTFGDIAPGGQVTHKVTFVRGSGAMPNTGDSSLLMLWSILALGSVGLLAYQAIRRKMMNRMLSLLLCAALIAPMFSMFAVSPAAAQDQNDTRRDLEIELYVPVDDIDTRIGFEIGYTSSFLTRGQWIQMLMDFLYTGDTTKPEDILYSYADIENHPNGYAIELANGYGILPSPELEDEEQDVPLFEPDAVADRDFAAYTAAKAMGFTGEHRFDVSGWADIRLSKYPDMAAIAVGFEMMSLEEGNCFNPQGGMTNSMASEIFDGMRAIEESAKIDADDLYDRTEYRAGVMRDELSSVTDYDAVRDSNNTYRVNLPTNDSTLKITAGKVIVLPPTDDMPGGIALKVQSVSRTGGSIELVCTVPEMHEVVESIDFVDIGKPVVKGIKAVDDVKVSYSAGGSDELYPLTINEHETFDYGKVTFEFPKNGYQIKGDLKVKGSLEVEIPKVEAKVKAKIGLFDSSLDEFLLSISEKVEIKGELEYMGSGEYSAPKMSDRVEIGRIPFHVGAGFSFELVFFFIYEVKGTLGITYEIQATQGFQYKNGAPRVIMSFGHDLKMLEIAASAKAGFGASGMLVFATIWDLIGYQINGGAGLNAALTPHVLENNRVVCGDITLYGYLESCLDKETLIGELLDEYLGYSLEFKHLQNNSSNPHKLKFHVENMKRVPECTFDGGALSGVVADASTGNPIRNARVTIYRGTGEDKRVDHILYTNTLGQFGADSLNRGKYTAIVTATGYKNYTLEFEMNTTGTKYLECQMLVERQQTEKGTIAGKATNAQTGEPVSGINYIIRKGWNVTTGDVVAQGMITGSSFNVNVDPGNYTVLVKKDGYVTNYVNVAVVSNGNSRADVVISPVNEGINNGDLRMVLTWGEHPYDLDSHLFASGSDSYHIFFADQEYYSGNTLIADLDVDDVTSYGPETTTVKVNSNNMKYGFYVHDYTNLDSMSSTALARSGAKIQVYKGAQCVATYNVPSNKDGTVWHVFDYDAATGSITPVNTFSYSSNPDSLNVRRMLRMMSPAQTAGITEHDAVSMIRDSAAISKKK